MRQDTRDSRKDTGDKRNYVDKRQETRERKQETGTFCKNVMGENFFKIRLFAKFFDGANLFPKMWQGGAKIM